MYRTNHFRKPRAIAGFTLIELMVVVAIVAILAAIAFPSYTNQIRKSRRGDAKIALLDMAARQERFNTLNFQYATTMAQLNYANAGTGSGLVSVPGNGNIYYQLTMTFPVAGGFLLTATAVGDQANDGCKNFTLTDLGVQGLTGNATNSVADCWK